MFVELMRPPGWPVELWCDTPTCLVCLFIAQSAQPSTRGFPPWSIWCRQVRYGSETKSHCFLVWVQHSTGSDGLLLMLFNHLHKHVNTLWCNCWHYELNSWATEQASTQINKDLKWFLLYPVVFTPCLSSRSDDIRRVEAPRGLALSS